MLATSCDVDRSFETMPSGAMAGHIGNLKLYIEVDKKIQNKNNMYKYTH